MATGCRPTLALCSRRAPLRRSDVSHLSREITASRLTVAGAAAVAAALGAIGADARWLAALGREIVAQRGIPDGVPYAAAPSEGWPNVLVAAELAFHAFEGLGDRGLLLAQVLAVAVAFAVLAWDARRGGASDASTALVLIVVVVGAFPAIAVVRLQLFSLALFPVLLLLLRNETREPSRRIWLLVPLIAVWGNLHGAVLVGLAVASLYLLLERARFEPLTAAGVVAASVAALFVNPALDGTVDYYRGVLGNEAARRGVGLWERIDPTSALGVILVLTATVLVLLAVKAGVRPWELAVFAALAILTIRTSRSGVWLLFAAAPPAAAALSVGRELRRRIAVAATALASLIVIVGVVRGPLETGATERTLDAALATADGGPILAEPALAEEIVAAGGRVWLGNPLDAFDRNVQKLYLDWVAGSPRGDGARTRSRAAVVFRDGDAHRRLVSRGEQPIAEDDRVAVFGVPNR